MIRDKGESRREGEGRGGLTELMEMGDIARKTSLPWALVLAHTAHIALSLSPLCLRAINSMQPGHSSKRYADGRTIIKSPTPM